MSSLTKSMQDRAESITRWLEQQKPRCTEEQAHLEEGSRERVYWHYGYLVALRDVLQARADEFERSQRRAERTRRPVKQLS
jgi:hypothetical protein